MIDRVNNTVNANPTPIGLIPRPEDIDLNGLDIPKERMEKLFEVNLSGWKTELDGIKSFLRQFDDRLPDEIWEEFKKLERKTK
jgi:phosphoenolpyruvate carboxykinase (GTP)